MTDDFKKFMEAASSNEELKTKIEQISKETAERSGAEIIAVAKEYGYEITADDFKPENMDEMRELTEDELAAVAGGAKGACACPMAGGGAPWNGATGWCACVLGGRGQFYDEKHQNCGFCYCAVAGGGGATDN